MPLRPPKGYVSETDPRVSPIGHAAPPWLVNYADLMTELVCFFVIMYALSAALNKDVQHAARRVREMIQEGHVAGSVKVDREGLKITLQEQGQNVFFESGSAELTPDMETLMGRLAPTLEKLIDQHDIIVEGHTDDIPIRNDLYQNNWELSTSRATNVVVHLVREKRFAPQRMAAVGYGEFRPIAANDSPEHRAQNRRVVFFIKNAASNAPKTGPPSSAASPENAAPPPRKAWFERVLSRIRPK
ncbi:MAG: flagellar motor protein MotB [Elusimicrobia bacterium]|nr:flagellar motor protein MotB [Elusimicrobiota bacterium]